MIGSRQCAGTSTLAHLAAEVELQQRAVGCRKLGSPPLGRCALRGRSSPRWAAGPAAGVDRPASRRPAVAEYAAHGLVGPSGATIQSAKEWMGDGLAIRHRAAALAKRVVAGEDAALEGPPDRRVSRLSLRWRPSGRSMRRPRRWSSSLPGWLPEARTPASWRWMNRPIGAESGWRGERETGPPVRRRAANPDRRDQARDVAIDARPLPARSRVPGRRRRSRAHCRYGCRKRSDYRRAGPARLTFSPGMPTTAPFLRDPCEQVAATKPDNRPVGRRSTRGGCEPRHTATLSTQLPGGRTVGRPLEPTHRNRRRRVGTGLIIRRISETISPRSSTKARPVMPLAPAIRAIRAGDHQQPGDAGMNRLVLIIALRLMAAHR